MKNSSSDKISQIPFWKLCQILCVCSATLHQFVDLKRLIDKGIPGDTPGGGGFQRITVKYMLLILLFASPIIFVVSWEAAIYLANKKNVQAESFKVEFILLNNSMDYGKNGNIGYPCLG